jgi:hypothetical protein
MRYRAKGPIKQWLSSYLGDLWKDVSKQPARKGPENGPWRWRVGDFGRHISWFGKQLTQFGVVHLLSTVAVDLFCCKNGHGKKLGCVVVSTIGFPPLRYLNRLA